MIRPTQDRIILKKDVVNEQQKGLIIVPGDKGTPCIGTIMAKGPGKKDLNGVYQSLDAEVGDRVLYNKHGGQPIVLDDEEFLVLYFHDVFGVVI